MIQRNSFLLCKALKVSLFKNKKEIAGGDDIDKWTFDEIKEIVEQFIEDNTVHAAPKPEPQEKKHEEEHTTTAQPEAEPDGVPTKVINKIYANTRIYQNQKIQEE